MIQPGYIFKLTDGSEIKIAPKPQSTRCIITHKGFELDFDVKTATFTLKALEISANTLGVTFFTKTEFTLSEEEIEKAKSSNETGILWCSVRGGCCNCGSGWVCNGVI